MLQFVDAENFKTPATEDRDEDPVQLLPGSGVLSQCTGLGIQYLKRRCFESAPCRELAWVTAWYLDLQMPLSTWIGPKGLGDFPGTCGICNKDGCLKIMMRLQPRCPVSETGTLDFQHRVACRIHANRALYKGRLQKQARETISGIPLPLQGWGNDQERVRLQSLFGRELWVTATTS